MATCSSEKHNIRTETKYCLEVHGYRAENGAAVGVWECTGQHSQRWWKDPDGALRPTHAFDYCLEVPFSNFKQGTTLQIWACNQTPAQHFLADMMPQWLPQHTLAASATMSATVCFTALGPAPESACAANEPDVISLCQLLLPGGPTPRGCVTDEKAFIKGLPAEASLNNVNGLPIGYNTAKAFAFMNGAKYFALARTDTGGYGYIFDAEPTTAPMLNITVNGSSGCYSPCADEASKACGSADGYSNATAPRVWFVYELPK
ncbi:hypothetical protein OEZ86_001529 [Tetradesmus obliquus]|nr:hypothetical protein OEZ86_001529 [Tetradesmus obliquus]